MCPTLWKSAYPPGVFSVAPVLRMAAKTIIKSPVVDPAGRPGVTPALSACAAVPAAIKLGTLSVTAVALMSSPPMRMGIGRSAAALVQRVPSRDLIDKDVALLLMLVAKKELLACVRDTSLSS